MKKLIIIILAAVLAGGGALAGFAIYNNQPENVATSAISEAVEDLLEREEIAPLANMLKGGSLEISAEVDPEKLGLGLFGNDALKAGGKMYFSEDAFMLEKLSVEYGDVKLSGDAYVGEDIIYVTNKDILGGTYGIIRGKMASAFKNSEFAELLALDEDGAKLITQILEDYDNGKDKDLIKDLEKYIEKYLDVAVKAFKDNADFETENDTVKVNGEKINARVVEVTIDGKTIAAIADALSDELKEDDKLRDLVDEYLKPYKDVLKEEGIIEKSTKELYNDVVKGLADYADEVKKQDGDVIVSIVTPKMSSELVQLSVTLKEGKEKTELFTLNIGKGGIKKTDCISIEMDGVKVEYQIKDNDSKKYSSELNLIYEEDDEEINVCKITVDKKKESFKIVAGEDGEVTLSGDFISKGKKTTISLKKISARDVEIKDGFELTLVISEKDKMPKPTSKVTNIFKLDEEDIKEIKKNAEDFFGDNFGFGVEAPGDPEANFPDDWYGDDETPEKTDPEYTYHDDWYGGDETLDDPDPEYTYPEDYYPTDDEPEKSPEEPWYDDTAATPDFFYPDGNIDGNIFGGDSVITSVVISPEFNPNIDFETAVISIIPRA